MEEENLLRWLVSGPPQAVRSVWFSMFDVLFQRPPYTCNANYRTHSKPEGGSKKVSASHRANLNDGLETPAPGSTS